MIDACELRPFFVLGQLSGRIGRSTNLTVYFADDENGRRISPIFFHKERAEAFIQQAGLPADLLEIPGDLLLQHLRKLLLKGISRISIDPRPGHAPIIDIFRILVELEGGVPSPVESGGGRGDKR